MRAGNYMANKKFVKDLLSYIIPMVLVVPLSVVGISQMHKSAYNTFFVIGQSMQPTLNGSPENSVYGMSDESEKAINSLNRFDLVICYYPFATSLDYPQPYSHDAELLDTATMKIKRVIGLPGDHLVINNEKFSIEYTMSGETKVESYSGNVVDDSGKLISEASEGDLTPKFARKGPIESRAAEITLAEGEYFVMGDNWTKNGSSDSCNPTLMTSAAPIYKENIAAVIVSLEGTCTYGALKHCFVCGEIVKENKNKCKCGGTDFKYYDDIIDKKPFDDGTQYLK